MSEWYKRFRPDSLDKLVGQAGAVKVLQGFIKKKQVPHAVMLHGPSGCGKTTIARILKEAVGCNDHNFQELNAADFRGIETIRDIRRTMGLSAMGGGTKVCLLDECHQLTKDSQTALLKMLEDPPKHVYFVLATTDPNKVIKTVRSRCTSVELCSLDGKALRGLVAAVAKKAKMDPPPAAGLVDKIVNTAEGSARQALVLLEQAAAAGPGEQDRLNAVAAPATERKSIELCRALMDPKRPWKEVREILKGIKEEDPEKVRYGVLGYATSALLNGWGNTALAAAVVEVFQFNLYDSKFPGLVLMSYTVVAKRK